MTTRVITLQAPSGLHARPAGELVKLAKSFAGTKITLTTTAKTVNAASMLSILSLGLKQGSEIEIGADGPDEGKAIEAVSSFIQNITE